VNIEFKDYHASEKIMKILRKVTDKLQYLSNLEKENTI
jgi:hypothetical protein